MSTYLALLRGVNVGGNSLVKMADLQAALSGDGLQNVRTYIQSGNIIFSSDETDTAYLAAQISGIIEQHFALKVDVVVRGYEPWKRIIEHAPAWWGKDKNWKHNLIVLTEPIPVGEVLQAIGVLKPDIERVAPGEGVLYQSLSWDKFGRTTSGKLASNPIYKKMTIRNYNTATKLLALMEQAASK